MVPYISNSLDKIRGSGSSSLSASTLQKLAALVSQYKKTVAAIRISLPCFGLNSCCAKLEQHTATPSLLWDSHSVGHGSVDKLCAEESVPPDESARSLLSQEGHAVAFLHTARSCICYPCRLALNWLPGHVLSSYSRPSPAILLLVLHFPCQASAEAAF